MPPKCEYPTSTIPDDPGYARVAAGYVTEIARIIGFDKSGRMHSAVAVMDGKDIAGNCALYFWGEELSIAEMVAGVVNPEFRSPDV